MYHPQHQERREREREGRQERESEGEGGRERGRENENESEMGKKDSETVQSQELDISRNHMVTKAVSELIQNESPQLPLL